MKRNLGDKNAFIADSHIRYIVELYTNFEETEHSKIYPNAFFGYTKVTIERPLMDEETGEVVRDKKGNPKPESLSIFPLTVFMKCPMIVDVCYDIHP